MCVSTNESQKRYCPANIPYRSKFLVDKVFCRQNFRHQVEISAVLSAEILSDKVTGLSKWKWKGQTLTTSQLMQHNCHSITYHHQQLSQLHNYHIASRLTWKTLGREAAEGGGHNRALHYCLKGLKFEIPCYEYRICFINGTFKRWTHFDLRRTCPKNPPYPIPATYEKTLWMIIPLNHFSLYHFITW